MLIGGCPVSKSSSVAKGESAVSDATGESAETRDALASKEARDEGEEFHTEIDSLS